VTDVIQLESSDAHGNMVIGGADRHFVRYSDNPHMHAVNQMHDGGQFLDADCAVADTQSAMLDRGIQVSAITIEQEDATTANGTLVARVVIALRDAGIACHVANETPPGGLYVMNSAWGGIIAPADTGMYYACSLGWGVVIDAPEPWHTPTPTPTQEIEMLEATDPVVQAINGKLDGISKQLADVRAAESAADLVLWLKAHNNVTHAGGDQLTEWNIQAQGDDGSAANVHVYVTPYGQPTPINSRDYTSTANHAGVAGPQQAAGSTAELGISGPCQIEFVNDGPADVELTLHP